MGAVSKYTIIHDCQLVQFLEWLGDHKYRNVASCDEKHQLEHAKAVAACEDSDDRTIMLKLLDDAGQLQDKLVAMHLEMDTVFKALRNIEDSEEAKKET